MSRFGLTNMRAPGAQVSVTATVTIRLVLASEPRRGRHARHYMKTASSESLKGAQRCFSRFGRGSLDKSRVLCGKATDPSEPGQAEANLSSARENTGTGDQRGGAFFAVDKPLRRATGQKPA